MRGARPAGRGAGGANFSGGGGGGGLAGGSGRPHAPPAAGALEGQVPNCPRGLGWGAACSLQAEQYPDVAAPQSAGASGAGGGGGGGLRLGEGEAGGKFGEALCLSPGVPLSADSGAGWANLRRRGIPPVGEGRPIHPRAPASPPGTGWKRGRAQRSEWRARRRGPGGCSVSETQKLSRKSGAPRPERGDLAEDDICVCVWGGGRPW